MSKALSLCILTTSVLVSAQLLPLAAGLLLPSASHHHRRQPTRVGLTGARRLCQAQSRSIVSQPHNRRAQTHVQAVGIPAQQQPFASVLSFLLKKDDGRSDLSACAQSVRCSRQPLKPASYSDRRPLGAAPSQRGIQMATRPVRRSRSAAAATIPSSNVISSAILSSSWLG